MVNWLKTWRRASFRGAHFWVDRDQVQTGRRLVVHEFPHRNTPYIEDLGRSANRISVTAYIASDNLLREGDRLFKACSQGGAATLQLPEERLKAHCESCERAWDKDKQGFLAFSLQFWREGSGSGPFPAPYLQRLTFSAAAAVTTAVGQYLAATVSTVGRAGFVRDAAADDIRNIAAELSAVREALPLDTAKEPVIVRAVQDIYDDAETLAAIGSVGNAFAADSFVTQQRGDEATAELAERIAGVVGGMRESASANDVAVALAPLTEPASPDTVVARTLSRRIQVANSTAIALALRLTALAQWAVAVTDIEYRDRRTAIQARADLAERFDAALEALEGPTAYAAYVALSEVRDNAIQYFTRLLTDLAPVQIFETYASMPSLWWANRLYADASRAEELAARNRALHASFMPLEIEALAR